MTTAGWPAFGEPPRLRRAAAAVVVSMLLALVAVLGGLGGQSSASAADANGRVNIGDCSFRKADGDAKKWANQMCWIDASDIAKPGTHNVTKRFGDYTLTYTVTVEASDTGTGSNKGSLSAGQQPPWSRAAFGNQIAGQSFFVAETGATANDIFQTEKNRFVRLSFRNVKFTYRGQPLPSFRMMVADAESTGSVLGGEMISVDVSNSGGTGTVNPPIRLTPNGSREACRKTFGAGVERNQWQWADMGGKKRDFICDNDSGGTYGTFLVGLDSPTAFEIGIASNSGGTARFPDPRGNQAFAMAIALNRISTQEGKELGTADTAAQQAFTGQAEQPVTRIFTQDGQQRNWIEPVGGSSTTPVLRRLNADGVPEDTVGLQSTMAGKDLAFRRYSPEWTCSAISADGATDTFVYEPGANTDQAPVRLTHNGAPLSRADAERSGIWFRENRAEGVSEVQFANKENREINCNVHWKSRFAPASLELNKRVTGTASNYAELAGKKFTIDYACTAPEGFQAAYPDVKLSGSREVQPGSRQLVDGLPAGATCTLKETAPAAVSGADLDLRWNGATHGTPNQGSAQHTLTLQPNTAPAAVEAENQYSARTATLQLRHVVQGPAATPVLQNQEFTFELSCPATNAPARQITVRGGAPVTVDGVPRGQDCVLRPVEGLTAEQQKYISLTSRDATGAAQQQDGLALRLPATGPAAAEPVEIRSTYDYRTADVQVHQVLAGPAGALPSVTGQGFSANYACTAPDATKRTGTVTLTDGHAVIPKMPVGSTCTLSSQEPTAAPGEGPVRTFELQSTTVAPQTLTVGDGQADAFTITRTYDYKYGTAQLSKVVTANGVRSLPANYTFNFACGSRNVVSNGTVEAIKLEGTATVAPGAPVTLKVGDPRVDDGPGATMRVPYGNTCTFTEDRPQLPGGVNWDTDVDNVALTITGQTNTATVNNTFTPAGNGLTITQRYTGEQALYPKVGVDYQLSCGAFQETFQLADGAQRTFSAAEIPAGTQCTLARRSPVDTQRTNSKGADYPITHTTVGHYAPGGEQSTELAPGVAFTVGERATLAMEDEFAYQRATLTGVKRVRFDPATKGLIAPAKQEAWLGREYPASLRCVLPDGTPGASLQASVRNGVAVTQGDLVVGSSCTVAENPLTPEPGIHMAATTAVDGTPGNTFTVLRAGNSVEFINTFSRRVTDATVRTGVVLPGTARQDYEATGKTLGAVLPAHPVTMVCRDGDAELLRRSAIVDGEGAVSVAGVPVGAACTVELGGYAPLDLQADTPEDSLRATMLPDAVDWTVSRPDSTLATGKPLEQGNEAAVAPAFVVEEDAAANVVRATSRYVYQTAPLKLRKDIEGNSADMRLLGEANTMRFALQCRALGTELTSVEGLPLQLQPGDFTAVDGGLRYISTGGAESAVPVGAHCRLREIAVDNVPAQLTVVAAQPSVEADVTTQGAELHLVNKISRRTTNLQVAMRQTGYLHGADPAGYTGTLVCKDGDATLAIRPVQFSVAEVPERPLPGADAVPVTGLRTVEVPAGTSCTLTMDAAAALSARGELEVSAGDRRPYLGFAAWHNGTYDGPDTTVDGVAPQDVGAKQYEYAVDVPVDAPDTTAADPAVVVGVQAHHPRATVDVAFTKQAAGAPDAEGTYTFRANCGDGTRDPFTLRAGQTHVLRNVPVGSDCTVEEEQTAGTYTFALTSQGAKLGEGYQPETGTPTVAFKVLAPEATDTARAGEAWTATALNKYASVALNKRIAGTPLSGVTNVVDTALLPDHATTMDVTYELTNTGQFDLSNMVLRDPALAGMTVRTPDGPHTIGEQGTIPAAACSAVRAALAPGQSATCTVTVDIPAEGTFRHRGTATLQAATGTLGAVSAESTYGALRVPSTIGWLLPDTGSTTLVWILLLGLLIFGFSARRLLTQTSTSTTPTTES
ncbi:CshA/CshB family fibrillar adhesin-related protein [uncultured Corynebacterium sp.]|uniref:CshA/CshB family fibrillar adhesin-related protein n=1 Tax=uncultured Corynebacterium sp. TaxID=159447 RepID=UPI002594FC36|nr:CshA/CshB family fibrillar adhesin-related protein [uncultured Corynebacterium sp.]